MSQSNQNNQNSISESDCRLSDKFKVQYIKAGEVKELTQEMIDSKKNEISNTNEKGERGEFLKELEDEALAKFQIAKDSLPEELRTKSILDGIKRLLVRDKIETLENNGQSLEATVKSVIPSVKQEIQEIEKARTAEESRSNNQDNGFLPPSNDVTHGEVSKATAVNASQNNSGQER